MYKLEGLSKKVFDDRYALKDKEGNQITDWFPCEFWGKQAELVGDIVQKGRLISFVIIVALV